MEVHYATMKLQKKTLTPRTAFKRLKNIDRKHNLIMENVFYKLELLKRWLNGIAKDPHVM